MLYVFFGKNQMVVREKAFAHLHSLQVGESDIVKISADQYSEEILIDTIERVPLFGEKQIILLDTPSDHVLFREHVGRALTSLHASPHHFVILEQNLSAPLKKMYAGEADHFEEVVTSEKEEYESFALADALRDRDKKKMWLLLMGKKERGEKIEAVVGTLFWQIKLLRLAERTQSPKEAGQNAFPYNKAKRALEKFGKGELQKLSRELVQLYHDGHGGTLDMWVGLERWVLKV